MASKWGVTDWSMYFSKDYKSDDYLSIGVSK